MGQDRVTVALDRMERALSRLEAAARQRETAAAESPELTSLRSMHEKLRGRVETAIAQIDRLLDAEPG